MVWPEAWRTECNVSCRMCGARSRSQEEKPRFWSWRVCGCLGCQPSWQEQASSESVRPARQRPRVRPAAGPHSAGHPQLPGRFQGSPWFCECSLGGKGALPGRPTRAASVPRLESAPLGSLPRSASCQPHGPEGHPNSKAALLNLSPLLQEHTTPPYTHTCKSLSFPLGRDGC